MTQESTKHTDNPVDIFDHFFKQWRDHERAIVRLQRRQRFPGLKIYWGTPTQVAGQTDPVTGMTIANLITYFNPPPFNASPWLPFLNGWNNNTSGGYPPCSMSWDAEGLVFDLGYTGGTANTAVVNLPVPFRPNFQTPIWSLTNDALGITRAVLHTSGDFVDAGVWMFH